jgi:hypothetical protein
MSLRFKLLYCLLSSLCYACDALLLAPSFVALIAF